MTIIIVRVGKFKTFMIKRVDCHVDINQLGKILPKFRTDAKSKASD